MSAKEIEEILNKVKNSIKKHKEEGYTDDMLVILEFDVIQWNLLLSYIEQLENNRDKALKKLYKYRNRKDHYCLWCMEYIDNADIIHILKGDSEWIKK